MNRLLRNLFFALAVLFAAYAALFANYLRVAGWGGEGKIIIGAAAISIFLALAGWFFPLKIKFRIFMVLLGLLLVELVMQAATGLGVLPSQIKDRAPFARVYWMPEGFSNGIRNRFGWYAQAFDLQAAHKIALIGDSQVEGLEVPRTQNQAADLQKLLDENPGGGWSSDRTWDGAASARRLRRTFWIMPGGTFNRRRPSWLFPSAATWPKARRRLPPSAAVIHFLRFGFAGKTGDKSRQR